MKFFESCHKCPKGKRHAGCHADCPDYLKDKEQWESHNNLVRENRNKESSEYPIKARLSKYKH